MKNQDGARAVVESNRHRKGRDHCQPKYYRKTLDEVLRVEREGARHGAFKVLVNCGETYCVGNAGTCGPQSADRHRKKVVIKNCTVRALPRWSPTRVLDTPMVA